ncbi:MAG: PAS domain S-box protein [Nisaea sp.]|uniref:PAS domain S-box protein n=1 Tax=Nisaea sp. TaxID=2024842 RepID=UPI001B036A5F|nr:PAS domain S-box protein [Nisaea sp.]
MTGAAGETTTKLDNDFYRDIVRHTADAIIAIDADQKIVFANPAMEQMFGYPSEELLGQDLNILLPDRFRKDHVAQVHNFLSSGEDARYMGKRLTQIVGRRADGEEIRIGAMHRACKSWRQGDLRRVPARHLMADGNG